ncbi:SMI1/KNR4 family protein [Amycolatopsis tolypomycina]|uniref:SMI1/KNR4 family protein n=1 Tax=Amycolatopsis tolypomycina TaxID=208445 RepID=UPI0033B2248B
MTSGEPGFGAIARAMAEALRANAGSASGATLQLRHTGSAISCRAWNNAWANLSVDLLPIAKLLRGRPPSALEVQLAADGSYTFTARPDIATVSPGRLVFDPGFRYPGHPRPGLPRPAGTEPTGAPTDPAVLAEVTRLTSEFAELYAGIKGGPPPWASGLGEADLAAAEARIGVRLPEDLRALYLVADGDMRESGLLGPYCHESLGRLVHHYLDGEPGSYGWDDDPDDDGLVFETPPFGHVKRLSRNDWWVTFGTDLAGNFLLVDLDPAERGRAGQVLEYGRDIYGPPRYVAPSITAMLTEVVEALRAGKYESRYGATVAAETGLREEPRSFDEGISDAADLPATVAGLAGPELVQQVYLNDLGDVDLAVFEPLTSLRSLSVNRAGAVTPTIRGLEALESVQIHASRVELAALAGHPVLWDLQLADSPAPLDLTVLRTLPNLTRLSLEGSAVPDWGPVCALPALRVLKLDMAQVRALLGSGHPLPRLAALFVSGRTTLPEMNALRLAFGEHDAAGTVTELSGALT